MSELKRVLEVGIEYCKERMKGNLIPDVFIAVHPCESVLQAMLDSLGEEPKIDSGTTSKSKREIATGKLLELIKEIEEDYEEPKEEKLSFTHEIHNRMKVAEEELQLRKEAEKVLFEVYEKYKTGNYVTGERSYNMLMALKTYCEKVKGE